MPRDNQQSQGFRDFDQAEIVDQAILKAWVIRGCLTSSVLHHLVGNSAASDLVRKHVAAIYRYLGIASQEKATSSWVAELTKMLDRTSSNIDLSKGQLFANLALLGNRIGLSVADQHVLAFRIMFRLFEPLRSVTELYDQWTDIALERRLATILNQPESAIEKALSPEGALRKSGLIRYSLHIVGTLEEKISLPAGLINALIRPHKTLKSLMRFVMSPAKNGHLSVSDYPHLFKEISLTTSYLKAMAANRKAGIHVLLHGPPGTGKTELVKAICKDAGWSLYDIQGRSEDDPGSYSRLQSLITAQHILAKSRKSAILFDEFEDVIATRNYLDDETAPSKQFMNGFLEKAAVPTFWVTNHPNRLDPAYIRRFDVIIAVDVPPRSIRRQLLSRACEGLVKNGDWLDRNSAIPELSPALIERFSKVARKLSNQDQNGFFSSFDLLRDQYFKANGKVPPGIEAKPILSYDLGAVNVSSTWGDLAARLTETGNGRLLFHGPSGTGKSAFAKALADAIDRPLRPAQASDLLMPHQGETEHRIREVFANSHRDQAVLLIDEADSFLQARSRAVRSWEITQVNEFLTQVERFEGIVICTTNFIDSLDEAVMRRFDAKIEFGFLTETQRRNLFVQLCSTLGISEHAGESAKALDLLHSLATLTPGDFATVSRRFRLSSAPATALEVIAALCDEQKHKDVFNRRRIGFIN